MFEVAIKTRTAKQAARLCTLAQISSWETGEIDIASVSSIEQTLADIEHLLVGLQAYVEDYIVEMGWDELSPDTSLLLDMKKTIDDLIELTKKDPHNPQEAMNG